MSIKWYLNGHIIQLQKNINNLSSCKRLQESSTVHRTKTTLILNSVPYIRNNFLCHIYTVVINSHCTIVMNSQLQ